MPQKSRNALDGDIITIHRGLAIYKVKASPFWHARIRDHRSKKYVVRSTKETSRVKARQAAKELEFEILGGEKRVEREYTFRFYAARLLSRSEVMVERKERNANYVRTMKQFLNNEEWGLLKAFGTKDVRELRTREFQQYMDDLNRKRPDLSTSTRNTLTATFRNVLKVARDDGTIDALPATPRGRQVDNGTVPGRTQEEAEALRPEDYVLLPCPGDDDDYADDTGQTDDTPFPYPESTRLPAATSEDVQALLKKLRQ